MIPRDKPALLLIASPILLYIGFGIGLPLVLSNDQVSSNPNALLHVMGFSLLGASILIPPALLYAAARTLQVRWAALYGITGLIFSPVITFFIGLYLWGRREATHNEH